MIISLGDDPKSRSEKAGDMGQKRQKDKKMISFEIILICKRASISSER